MINHFQVDDGGAYIWKVEGKARRPSSTQGQFSVNSNYIKVYLKNKRKEKKEKKLESWLA